MTSIELRPELRAQLDAVKDQIGIPVSVQIRKAVEAWLRNHGPMSKPTRGKRS